MSLNLSAQTCADELIRQVSTEVIDTVKSDKAIQADSKESGAVRVIRLDRDAPGADAIATIILSDRENARNGDCGAGVHVTSASDQG